HHVVDASFSAGASAYSDSVSVDGEKKRKRVSFSGFEDGEGSCTRSHRGLDMDQSECRSPRSCPDQSNSTYVGSDAGIGCVSHRLGGGDREQFRSWSMEQRGGPEVLIMEGTRGSCSSAAGLDRSFEREV